MTYMGPFDGDPQKTDYVPEPPRNLKADDREWTITLPDVPAGHHVEIELPRHHGLREPVVRVVKNPTEASDGSDST